MLDTAVRAEESDSSLYDSGGPGAALLLLHGIGGTWHIWKPVLQLLGRRHRVIAMTLPGHHGGPAYVGHGDATVAGVAEQLIAALQSKGIHHAHVAGNSLGGWLALELGRRGFARSVVALSPAGGWSTGPDYQAIARPFRIIYALMPLILFLCGWFLRFPAFRKWLGRQTMQHGDRISEPEFRLSLQAMANTSALHGLLRSMQHEGPIQPMQVEVPTLIAWSDCDRVIPFERYGHTMLERVSGARSAMLHGTGHVPMYDDPQQVTSCILGVSDAAAQERLQSVDAA